MNLGEYCDYIRNLHYENKQEEKYMKKSVIAVALSLVVMVSGSMQASAYAKTPIGYGKDTIKSGYSVENKYWFNGV